MNVVLAVDATYIDYQQKLPLNNFCQIITSTHSDRSLAIADLSLQLDNLIFLQNHQVDLVLFAVNDQIKWDSFSKLCEFAGVFYNAIWYTDSPDDLEPAENVRLAVNGNFYCTPKVFSMLGAAYKAEDDDEPIRNFVNKCGIGWDLDFIRHRYIIERGNIRASNLK